MAEVSLEVFEDHILPEVSRAPTDLVTMVTRDIAREFCKYTRAWQVVSANKSIAAQVATYFVDLPFTDAYPIGIEFVQVNTAQGSGQVVDPNVPFGAMPSEPKAVDWLDLRMPNWRVNPGDDFRYYAQTSRRSFTFCAVPVTNRNGALLYRASFMPSATSLNIDSEVHENWYEPIANGVKARLFSMKTKSWADPARAVSCQRDYLAQRGLAKIAIAKGYGRTEEQWEPKYKFAGK